ncbi:MAG: allantoate amidohydrolase [Pirellulaceae bacterium]
MAGAPHITIDEQLLQTTASRLAERCYLLASHSEQPDCLTRTFCSPAMKTAHRQLGGWMKDAQMDCDLDAVGNMIGKYNAGSKDGDRVFMIGSHLDTVADAGQFDGVLGVLLGLGVVEVLQQAGVELAFDMHVIAFSEEEGVRYKFPFIGSRGITGTFDTRDLDRQDENGISIKAALNQFGCNTNQLDSASYAGSNLIGFMEPHIEQAVSLQDAARPVGVVSTIAGQTRATIVLEGKAGHAGTVSHEFRHDALAAAAELILRIEDLGRQTGGLFATVGDIVAAPGLTNVICGKAELRLDLRHESDEHRMAAFETISKCINDISLSRGVSGSIEAIQHTPAVPMDAELSEHLHSAITGLGLDSQTLVSGAGHDAMIMAQGVPSCMLFIRCRDGVSHHPDEFVSKEDMLVALKVMVSALIRLSNAQSQASTHS